MTIFVWDFFQLLPQLQSQLNFFSSSFFPMLIVLDNVCITLGLVRVDVLGLLELVSVVNKESWGFPR